MGVDCYVYSLGSDHLQPSLAASRFAGGERECSWKSISPALELRCLEMHIICTCMWNCKDTRHRANYFQGPLI